MIAYQSITWFQPHFFSLFCLRAALSPSDSHPPSRCCCRFVKPKVDKSGPGMGWGRMLACWTERFGVGNYCISYLLAVELDEVLGLAGEDAANALLLHDEAGRVPDEEPLEFGGHDGDMGVDGLVVVA